MTDPHHQQRAAQREHVDPEERTRPIPLLPALVTGGMIIWGVSYLILAGPVTPAQYGDQRTLETLRVQEGVPADGPVDGQAVYTANCVACHQNTGAGLAGVFPPLIGTEWVTGDGRLLANIILHGLSGELEIDGTTYNGVMPGLPHLQDAEIAAVASYVRSSWGNDADAVDVAVVTAEREAARRSALIEGEAGLKALRAEILEAAADTPEAEDAEADNAEAPEAEDAEADDAEAPEAEGAEADDAEAPEAEDAEADDAEAPEAEDAEADDAEAPEAEDAEAPAP